jgi:hypothetical protein
MPERRFEVNQTEQNLTKRQLRALPIILQARSISEGVEKAAISKTTFYEWIKQPAFKTEFERQRQEIIDAALHELKLTAGEAVRALRELLNTREDGVRLRTATAILDHIGKFIELENIEKRLSELEKRLVNGRY